ncbi:uncharacterized protein LODBEIA_P45440 [Lodderomyces beijingensis]|uniref:Uncharacterized protein n=1 Tax=Lodderomyces beijingensis TaxID=1775926 RepID=A0ABP0ZVG1_9ASCO
MGTSNADADWSFSFYEREYFDTSDTEQEEMPEQEQKQDTGDAVLQTQTKAEHTEATRNLYNPFILSKINYFTRVQARTSSAVYNKKSVVKSSTAMEATTKDGNANVLVWKTTLAWSCRKGNPTEMLLSTIAARAGVPKEKLYLTKDPTGPSAVGDTWFTVTTPK